MRFYQCACGQPIYFDNSKCLSCTRMLGFCPACRNLTALIPRDGGHFQCARPQCGVQLAKCFNYAEYNVCNRCVTVPAEPGTLCDCCRYNATIPDLNIAGNKQKWYRLEAAKRRLFYDLYHLGLPYGMAGDGIDPPLSFDFKADDIPKGDYWRGIGKAQQVYTGHANGRITINIREADDVERETLRVDLGESQRTLIGHFRHEIGHFYWEMLVKGRREADCIRLFGDHNRPPYAEALDAFYKSGPPANWSEQYISAYATMHPWEDFAETWATYLDMVSALDTAEHTGFGGETDPVRAEVGVLVLRYQQLGMALNEINRSMGLIDVVPEIFVQPVIAKLRFIPELVKQGRAENGAIQAVNVTLQNAPLQSGAIHAPPRPTASSAATSNANGTSTRDFQRVALPGRDDG